MSSKNELLFAMLSNADERKKRKIIEIVVALLAASDRVLDIAHKTVIALVKYQK